MTSLLDLDRGVLLTAYGAKQRVSPKSSKAKPRPLKSREPTT